MAEISFTSGIRPIPLETFGKTAASIGTRNFVNFPWTINESVKAPMAYTRHVCDCTMLGLTDGQDVLMMHLCPSMESNHNFFDIRQFIARNMDLKNPELQAILVGSKPAKKSQSIYNMLAEFLQTHRIPYSELKIGKDPISTAYSSRKDEWMISSPRIDRLLKRGMDSPSILKDSFNKVKISSADEIL